MEESLENVMGDIFNTLIEAQQENLVVEIFATALIELRDNPNKTIKDCLNYGINEWIK